MSAEAEREFLVPWAKQSGEGGVLMSSGRCELRWPKSSGELWPLQWRMAC